MKDIVEMDAYIEMKDDFNEMLKKEGKENLGEEGK